MKAELAALLAADSTINTALTGGIHSTVTALSKAQTSNAFDSLGRVKPCAVVKTEMKVAMGPREQYRRHICQVWFYESIGQAGIQTASARAETILHDVKLAAGYVIRLMDTLPDMWDDQLEANMIISRYTAVKE